MPSSGEDILRLAAVIDRQRQELDRARSGAAARSVIDMAKGALMERLGCSAAEAASQLTALAAEAGTPAAEIAAAIIGHDPVPPVPPGPLGLLGRRGSWVVWGVWSPWDGRGADVGPLGWMGLSLGRLRLRLVGPAASRP